MKSTQLLHFRANLQAQENDRLEIIQMTNKDKTLQMWWSLEYHRNTTSLKKGKILIFKTEQKERFQKL